MDGCILSRGSIPQRRSTHLGGSCLVTAPVLESRDSLAVSGRAGPAHHTGGARQGGFRVSDHVGPADCGATGIGVSTSTEAGRATGSNGGVSVTCFETAGEVENNDIVGFHAPTATGLVLEATAPAMA